MEIAFPAAAVIDHNIRLQLSNFIYQFLRLPEIIDPHIFTGLPVIFPVPASFSIPVHSSKCKPLTVEPEQINLSIITHQLHQLIMALFFQCLCTLPVKIRHEISWKAPVERRIIKANFHSFFPARLHIFFNKIPMCSSFHCGKITAFRIEQAKAIVVACCQHHVLHPRCLCIFGPLFRIKIFCKKVILQCLILPHIQMLIHQHPFPFSEHRIYSPVNKHAKLRIPEPFHLFFRQFFYLFRSVIFSCRRKGFHFFYCFHFFSKLRIFSR